MRLTTLTWIKKFVKLGGDQLVSYYADILGAILPCISDKEGKIRVLARETNEELRTTKADPTEGFDIGKILSISRRQLSSEWEANRIELHWISTLSKYYRLEVLQLLNDIFGTMLKALSDPSDEVVLLLLDVHACIAKDPYHFLQLVIFGMHNFWIDNSLLEKCGALIICWLGVLLDVTRVYRELSTILEREFDLNFASIMVQFSTMIKYLSKEISEAEAATLCQYVIAYLLLFFTIGTSVELGITSQIRLPPELVKFLTDPKYTEAPGRELLCPFVDSALPLAYGVLGVLLFHELNSWNKVGGLQSHSLKITLMEFSHFGFESGLVRTSELLFEKNCLSNRDQATWNAILASYTHNGLNEKAILLLKEL